MSYFLFYEFFVTEKAGAGFPASRFIPYDAENMYQRPELDYLIYNNPAAYADLILSGDPEAYWKAVPEYKSLDE